MSTAEFRMRMLRRPEQEEREVGLSWARAKVCRTNINQRSLRTKYAEKKDGSSRGLGAQRFQCGMSGEKDRPCGLLPRDSRFPETGGYRAPVLPDHRRHKRFS